MLILSVIEFDSRHAHFNFVLQKIHEELIFFPFTVVPRSSAFYFMC